MIMKITVEQAIEALKEIGKERKQVVNELSYSKQIAGLGDHTESLLENQLEKLTATQSKLLEVIIS